MDYVFYPKHERRCPDVGHRPHVGGAGLGMLVLAANEQNQYVTMLHGQLAEERRRNSALFTENQSLREQLAHAQRELKAERQQRYCKDRPCTDPPNGPAERRVEGKKRGAPVGHPGWFRPRPTAWDRCLDVPAPTRCPHCGGDVRIPVGCDPGEHLQEDIVDGRRQVVLYRHPAAGKSRAIHDLKMDVRANWRQHSVTQGLTSSARGQQNRWNDLQQAPHVESRNCPEPAVFRVMLGGTFSVFTGENDHSLPVSDIESRSWPAIRQ